MFYLIEDQNGEYDNTMLTHVKDFSEEEFNKILSSIRFQQGRWVDFDSGITTLIRDYGFKHIPRGYL